MLTVSPVAVRIVAAATGVGAAVARATAAGFGWQSSTTGVVHAGRPSSYCRWSFLVPHPLSVDFYEEP